MVRAGGQKMVAATFRHDTSRNLDPQLHTHAVVANMVQGGDGKWRTMVNDGLYRNKMAIGAVYRAELARGVKDLGYGIEKTHGDGRFEIAGVSREVVEGFSTRRAEIEAAMAARDEGAPLENPKLADRAALMTRARKRDVDNGELRRSWERQAAELGFLAEAVRAKARQAERERPLPDLFSDRGQPAVEAATWAVEHLSERQAVFGHGDLLAAALAREPGAVTAEAAEQAIGGLAPSTGERCTSYRSSSEVGSHVTAVCVARCAKGNVVRCTRYRALWRSLKYEAVYLHELSDGLQAQRLVARWFAFMIGGRPHSALGGSTPVDAYEKGMLPEMQTKRPGLPTPLPAQLEQRDVLNRTVAAYRSSRIHLNSAAHLPKVGPPH